MFPPGKYAKGISGNAYYIVAFKNPRDQLGMRNLLLQAFSTQWQVLQDTFQRLTGRPFGYIVLDLHPGSSDDQRILSHILKKEVCHVTNSSRHRDEFFPRFNHYRISNVRTQKKRPPGEQRFAVPIGWVVCLLPPSVVVSSV